MPELFISYRRSDTQMVAGRLRESLARKLGEQAIFRDKNSIPAGEDWTKAIDEALSGRVVVLALIGPSWATAHDEAGHRRLDDPADWNRVELERALERRRLVIPLLVDDAKMPAESELPQGLTLLARSNALKLRDDDWDSDIERLVRALDVHGTWARVRRPAVVAMLAVVIASGTGYWWLRSGEGKADRTLRTDNSAGSTYQSDVVRARAEEQKQALGLLGTDKPRAVRLIDDNIAKIDEAIASFPESADLHSLGGYAAKNVYASSKGILPAQMRRDYLLKAQTYFERALELDPKNPGAVNGMGNVLFYERRFDEASQHYEKAIKLAGGIYPEAEHDLDLVKRVKRGQAAFDP
jgi:tetratricopeptide (TPR) repeat protein